MEKIRIAQRVVKEHVIKPVIKNSLVLLSEVAVKIMKYTIHPLRVALDGGIVTGIGRVKANHVAFVIIMTIDLDIHFGF